jgi:hypothetical protein
MQPMALGDRQAHWPDPYLAGGDQALRLAQRAAQQEQEFKV